MQMHNPGRTRARRLLWLRARALLAGGLVLGVGAAVTLATWNDAEYASGTVSTSTFDLQSSLTTTALDFSSHPAGSALALQFPATGMAPGSMRDEQVFLRTAAGSIAGSVLISGATVPTGDAAFATNLVYRAIRLDAATCTATSFTSGTPVYIAGGSSAFVPLTTPSSAVTLAGVTPVGICVQLSLAAAAPNALQGKTASVQFIFTGTSITP